MEHFVYINGVFFDKVNGTPEEIAKWLEGEIDYIEPYPHPFCGPYERIYIRKGA